MIDKGPKLHSVPIRALSCYYLARAPLGYFYNAPHWGGGAISSPPLISETTGPIVKIQAAFESAGKTAKRKQILLNSGSRVTSQVRSKSKYSTFRVWWHRRAKLQCKLKQSQRTGMDSVSDICEYHLLCFVTIIEVKVISGHQVKKVKQKISWFRGAIHVFRSDFRKEREKWP